MKQFNWRSAEADAVLKRIEDVETRVLQGMRDSVKLTRNLLSCSCETLNYTCRVAISLTRLAGLCLGWLILVFAPFVIYPDFITAVWSALALTGSWFGFKARATKQKVIVRTMKGGAV